MAIGAVLLAPLSHRSRIAVRIIANWWHTGSVAVVVLFVNQTTSQDLWRELNRDAKASVASREKDDRDCTRIRARTWSEWNPLLTRAHAEAAGKSQTWQPKHASEKFSNRNKSHKMKTRRRRRRHMAAQLDLLRKTKGRHKAMPTPMKKHTSSYSPRYRPAGTRSMARTSRPLLCHNISLHSARQKRHSRGGLD